MTAVTAVRTVTVVEQRAFTGLDGTQFIMMRTSHPDFPWTLQVHGRTEAECFAAVDEAVAEFKASEDAGTLDMDYGIDIYD